MIGAIIGDIVGSIYEWDNIKTKDFPLFRDECFFTDDTVMTCAVAEAIMSGGKRQDFIDAMKKYGKMYPAAGYGGRFTMWLISKDSKPYNSYGNGSAMRVSPCAWTADCLSYNKNGEIPQEIEKLVKLSAEVTHNHPEGIKGAAATADAVYICRCYREKCQGITDEKTCGVIMNACKNTVKNHIEKKYGYDLSKTLDEIRPGYSFNETCQGTVPQAVTAFLESTGFEDAVRNAISVGGDSDTLAAITGSIAEAAYSVPGEIRNKALSYLDEPLLDIVNRWEKFTSGFRKPYINT